MLNRWQILKTAALQALKTLHTDERGDHMVTYAVTLTVLVAGVVVIANTVLLPLISAAFTRAGNALP